MTLVEILIASAVAALLMAGVMAAFVTLARTAAKNERLEQLATESRKAQELINRQLSIAINTFDENTALRNRPTFSNSNGLTPPSYRQITYRAPVGPPGSLPSDVATSSSSVTFNAPANLKPVVGDYFILDTPVLGRGIQITAVTDNRGGLDGNVTVTLASSLSAGTVSGSEPLARGRVEIQRERSFVVDLPTVGAKVTSLKWFENTATPQTVQVISDQVAAGREFLFRREPNDENLRDVAIGWSLALADASKIGGQRGKTAFFTTTSIGGSTVGGSSSLTLPKSGNTLVLSNPFAAVSTSVSTSTVSTSTSTSTSTTSSTSSKSTSTSTSTTSKSTTKTTSTSTTKTTSKSTTKTTSTSTTSKSTTKTTSKSTTSTSSLTTSTTSSKSASTTSTSATTSKSTTSTTTSKSTSKSTSTTTMPFDG